MNRSLAQCSSVDWLHWAVVLIVACDNNSALLPDSVFISAPENNSKNNPNFDRKTDQEKFKFCDDIYLEFLNSFLRNSSVIELINNASTDCSHRQACGVLVDRLAPCPYTILRLWDQGCRPEHLNCRPSTPLSTLAAGFCL